MNKTKLFTTVRILISLSLLVLLFWLTREHFAKIGQLLTSVKLFFFALAFLLFLLSVILIACRLRLAFAAQKSFFALRDLFSLSLIGYFFTNFMPTSIGGDLVKGYLISQRINSKMTSYTAIFIDRIIGLLSLVLIATVALAIINKGIEHSFIIWTVALLLGCCTVFVFFLFNKQGLKKVGNSLGLMYLLRVLKLDSLLKKIYNAMHIYKNHKKKIAQMLVFSIAAQFLNFCAVYLLSISLSIQVPFLKIILVMPVIAVLCMLPVTMNGLGLREWAFIFFFSPTTTSAAALSLSLLYLAVYLLASLIGGIIYLFWR